MAPETFRSYRGLPVAVLGASGFIGRWVARALCHEEAQVFLIVRDRAAAERVFSQYSIAGTLYETDLTALDAIGPLLRAIRPAILFNLVGYGVDRSEQDPHLAQTLNSDLPVALAQSMSAWGDANWTGQSLVHVGTAAEYGEVGGDLAESTLARPTTLYGKTKLAGTIALQHYCENTGARAITARPFSIYGPGEHAGRLLPSLLGAAVSTGRLALTSGRQLRDFTYVTDVSEALLRLGVAAIRPGEVINVATGRLTSVRRFVEATADITKLALDQLDFGALATRAEEMAHDAVTTRRLAELTGWKPSTPIEAGIRLTAQFHTLQQ
jgi:nucleoside-diphosphate-sugar epimerase